MTTICCKRRVLTFWKFKGLRIYECRNCGRQHPQLSLQQQMLNLLSPEVQAKVLTEVNKERAK